MTVKVWSYRVTTDAQREFVAHLLGRAWLKNGIRGYVGKVNEIRPFVYEMRVQGNVVVAEVVEADEVTTLEVVVHGTRTSQDMLFGFIPAGRKKIIVNPLLEELVDRGVVGPLKAEAYAVSVRRELGPLGRRLPAEPGAGNGLGTHVPGQGPANEGTTLREAHAPAQTPQQRLADAPAPRGGEAGYYADPLVSPGSDFRRRYFDGHRWTDTVD